MNSAKSKKRADLGMAVAEAQEAGKIKFDTNGHRCHADLVHGYVVALGVFSHNDLTDEDNTNLHEAIRSGTPTKPYKAGNCNLFQCDECAQTIDCEFDGVTVRASRPCPYPNGLPPFVFELNIPSGTMVVANDLRAGFPIVKNYNVNSTMGIQQTTMQYAKVGMAHCFVGNTCPSVSKKDRKKITEKFQIGRLEKNKVASVCTDLWWYSVVDLDDYLKNYGREHKNVELVACRPGVYRFTHQYHRIDPDKDGAVYSTIEWIREPDPVVDHRANYNAINFTAGQIVLSMMKDDDDSFIKRYKKLIGKAPKNAKVFRAVNQIFCVNGNGLEIHPNGWIGLPDIEQHAPEVTIPLLNDKFRWYPVSEWSWLAHCCGVGNAYADKGTRYLNKSFLDLAFNICQCIIKHGTYNYDLGRTPAQQADDEEKIVEFVKKCCKSLAKNNKDRLPEFILPVLESL